MKKKTNRREFIQYSTLGILGLLTAGGAVLSPYLKADNLLLRPPGAVDENDFLALCIKCGQCEQVCPYHSIELADITQGLGVGTPFIEPLKRACYLCTALPCVLACPTNALDHKAEKPQDVKIMVTKKAIDEMKASERLAINVFPSKEGDLYQNGLEPSEVDLIGFTAAMKKLGKYRVTTVEDLK